MAHKHNKGIASAQSVKESRSFAGLRCGVALLNSMAEKNSWEKKPCREKKKPMQKYIGLDVPATSCTLVVVSAAWKPLRDIVLETNGQSPVETWCSGFDYIPRMNLTMCLIARGQPEQARRDLQPIKARCESMKARGILRVVHSLLLACASALGDWTAFDDEVDALRRIAGR